MELKEYFPIWEKLTPLQQKKLTDAAVLQKVKKGTVVHNGSMDCLGLLAVCKGQLRAYILSDKGREITLYRLFERDICLFAASCIMRSIQFDITIGAEKDSELWIIRPEVYQEIVQESAPMANYMNEIMASRFSEVMWLVEQIMWNRFDQRLAKFLLEETSIEGTATLKITHEMIGNHLGTAREVVTRMLRYFQKEGLVKLTRGEIEVLDEEGLYEVSEKEEG